MVVCVLGHHSAMTGLRHTGTLLRVRQPMARLLDESLRRGISGDLAPDVEVPVQMGYTLGQFEPPAPRYLERAALDLAGSRSLGAASQQAPEPDSQGVRRHRGIGEVEVDGARREDPDHLLV